MPNAAAKIVLATQNPGKIAELRDLLTPTGLDVLGLKDLGDVPPEPEEDGTTFLENATTKAVAYAKHTGLRCLADDSGLIVDALDGAPGVISSHYAFDGRADGEAASMPRQQRDQLNNDRLLRDLEGIAPEQRTARFVCTMVLADPDGSVLASTAGAFEGRIGLPGDVPRGPGGFGYDPLFLVAPEFKITGAELPKETKNQLSHRGHAVRAMVEAIAAIT